MFVVVVSHTNIFGYVEHCNSQPTQTRAMTVYGIYLITD